MKRCSIIVVGASLGNFLGVLAAPSLLSRERSQVASGALQSNGQSPEQDRFSRETWLAAHLKDVFEMDSKSRLGPQSGLNIPWDHAKSRPRNAKNDCGDGPGSVVAEYTRAMMQAQEKGKLDAARLSSGR
eukprot:CAMPEP_0204175400 /NCGR_PEP_ID=MMETSP0361-20130328/46714_1 /ASSEMBLY_ACC=CAM_ASM_000343 /TAXON_ID=268821 /ORGANISM="Scrippsiella Hangoei, Strain SHTV-5" /LENGTH=129 /DNA_ID=CAMNT_0051134035 /DNA_START=24 /DNA_END=413 /DNA_ORIENTATION=+